MNLREAHGPLQEVVDEVRNSETDFKTLNVCKGLCQRTLTNPISEVSVVRSLLCRP